MKTRAIAFVLAILIALGGQAYAADTSGNEFINSIVRVNPAGLKPVGSREAFLNIKNDPYGSFYLTKDIDLGVWDEPFAFSGQLYGDGHTISFRSPGKMAVDSAYDYGLFSVIDYAHVENLKIHAVIDNAYQGAGEKPLHIGALAGRSTNGASISNCTAEVDISVSTVEWMNEGRTEYRAVDAVDPSGLGGERAVTAVGGLIGYADNQDGDIRYSAQITYSRCTGFVSGADSTGGMIGECVGDVYFLACENRAKVTGVLCVGGFVGKANQSCTIIQSANRGNVTAYRAYCGGFVGSGTTVGNDVISDSVNLAAVTLTSAKGMGETAGQFTGSGNIPIERCVYAGKLIAGKEENIPEFDEDELDTLYVWSKGEKGEFYPRALLGEYVNQYRAGYVRNMRDLCDKSAVNDLDTYLFTINPAMEFAKFYREAGLPEVHAFWYEFDKAVTDFMDFDPDSFNEVSLYDMLLVDLLMMDENYEKQKGDMENTLKDEFLESVKQFNEGTGALLAPSASYLEGFISIHSGTSDDYFLTALADSDDDALNKAMKHLGMAEQYRNAADTVDKAGKVSSVLGIVLDTMEAYDNYNEKADQERALREVYIKSFDRYERIFSEYYATNETPYILYDNPYEALRHVIELDDAIFNLRYNIRQEAQAKDKAGLYAAFAAGKGILEEVVSNVLLNSAGFQLLGYGSLYKLSAKIGLTYAEAMHIDEVSYNGLMLNCAAYMADGLQRFVQKKYNEFMQEMTYENALALNESLSLYLDLQILACKYAGKSALISYTDWLFSDSLKAREVDIRTVRGLLDNM